MRRAYSVHFVMFFVLCFFVQTISAALLPCLHSGQDQETLAVACPHSAGVAASDAQADFSMQECQRCTLDKVYSSLALPDLVRMTSVVTQQVATVQSLLPQYQSFHPDLLYRPPLLQAS